MARALGLLGGVHIIVERFPNMEVAWRAGGAGHRVKPGDEFGLNVRGQLRIISVRPSHRAHNTRALTIVQALICVTRCHYLAEAAHFVCFSK